MTESGSTRSAASPIALVGSRGCGKSHLGRLLAPRLGREFLDLDVALEEWRGASIPELFQAHGESSFRDWEADLLTRALTVPDRVLATGGGVVERAENRRLLRQSARVVYLRVEADVLVRRLQSAPVRPPLTDRPLAEEVATVLARRDPWYREVAELVLKVPDGEAPETTLERLARRLNT